MSTKVQAAVGLGAAMLGAYFAGKMSGDKAGEVVPKASNVPGPAAHGDLLEYSVVYTDRATNLMSSRFQTCMREISEGLKKVYQADGLALIPGSGSYAMEAAARQFGNGKKCMILRNGYFSFRWTDIFDQTKIAASETVIKARPSSDDSTTPKFAPAPLDEVVARILADKPDVVFAPHVETSTGIILPDAYIKAVAAAVHQVGGFFVLDCIASGTIWVDMKALGIDVVISAPQKGWSGPACVGIVMMNAAALQHVQAAAVNDSGSFSCNLKKWTEVMAKYEAGSFMYYTTLPTDALLSFRDAMHDTIQHGHEKAKSDLQELGERIRAVLEKHGLPSVAEDGFRAPGVVVSYGRHNMVAQFKEQGLQIAGGVPFKLDEPAGLITFRLGLFGLDKIKNIDRTVQVFEDALLRGMGVCPGCPQISNL